MKALRLSSVVLCAFACVATSVSAQLVNEPFTYPNGNLVGQDAWTAHSGAGVIPIQVSGGAAVLVQGAGTREDANKPLGTTMTAGTKLYAGFDVSVSAAAPLTTTTAEYFAHFKDAGAGTIFRARTFATGFAGSGYTYGLRAQSGTNPAVTWGSGFAFGTTQRLVISYEFDTGLTEMWVNPVNQASLNITHTDVVAIGAAIAAFGLRQSNPSDPDPTETVDNLCVDASWVNAFSCTPEPATLALLGFGALSLVRRRRR